MQTPMNPFSELDVVKVLRDLRGLGLQKGYVGTVVQVLDKEHVEVEFEFEKDHDHDGCGGNPWNAQPLVVLHVIDLKRVGHEPA
jgi:hypothetical protein